MFTDFRDGQKYRAVKIGNQTWMAENLNYKFDKSWCYDNDESNCKKYGKLYNWDAAMKACPAGWHLPSTQEWTALIQATEDMSAGKNLRSKARWKDDESNDANGEDAYGFSALPSGLYDDDVSRFGGIGMHSYWWSATESSDGFGFVCVWRMDNEFANMFEECDFGKNSLYSVRCIQD